jgi:flagellar basal-body rod protein FlgG
MMRSLNTAGTGMVAQQYNLDVIANNLANVNTTAFKQQRAEFQDLMYQTFRASGASSGGSAILPQATQVGLGAKFVGNAANFAPGPQQPTGNPTDLAINGEGFFQVERPNGEIFFTRDGSFKRDANGLLVNNDGYPIVPNVTIPASATAITITANGTVNAIIAGAEDSQVIGNIQLAMFTNPAGLTRAGQNLYRASAASGAAVLVTPGEQGSGEVQSSFLEGSNVQIVEEMVRMILAQRAYEINSKAIQTADEMLSILNNLKR